MEGRDIYLNHYVHRLDASLQNRLSVNVFLHRWSEITLRKRCYSSHFIHSKAPSKGSSIRKEPHFSCFNVSQRRTSSKLLSSHGIASFPLSTPYLLFPMKGRVICQCDRWQPALPDHVSLLGRVNCAWHVLLSPGLSVLSAVILCSKLYALGKDQRGKAIFALHCLITEPVSQVCKSSCSWLG